MLGRSHDGDERAPRLSPQRAGCSRRSAFGKTSPTEAQPILDMIVTDSRVDDVVRPVFLTFGGEVSLASLSRI